MGGGRRVDEVGLSLRRGREKKTTWKSESAFAPHPGINLWADRTDAASQGKC